MLLTVSPYRHLVYYTEGMANLETAIYLDTVDKDNFTFITFMLTVVIVIHILDDWKLDRIGVLSG